MSTSADAPRQRRLLGLDPEQRDAQRRSLVLGAALELFGTVGYGATSIEALCQAAGVGTNSFYKIFSSKEDVLVALYDQITRDLQQAVTDAYVVDEESTDPIPAMVGAFVHGATDDPRIAQVAFLESAGVSPAVEVLRRRTREQFIASLATIGTELWATGAASRATTSKPARDETGGRKPSARRIAVGAVGSIIEMTVDWLHDDDPDPVEHLIDDIVVHCHRLMASLVDR